MHDKNPQVLRCYRQACCRFSFAVLESLHSPVAVSELVLRR